MKAILINANTQTIEEIELGEEISEDINKILGSESYTIGHTLPAGDIVLVDTIGWDTKQTAFTLQGTGHPLGGSGIVVGSDEDLAGTRPPQITVAELQALVSFQTR